MNTIIIELPLQEQILLQGESKSWLLRRREIIHYLVDTRGYSFADFDEYTTQELVRAYLNDALEVEACAIYCDKAA